MKFYTSVILIALFSFIAGIYLPWWSIAVVSFLVALFIQQKAFTSFIAGFISIFILWAALASWIDVQNQQILSHRIAEILPLKVSSVSLILLTAFIGAIVAGFAALSGSLMRSIIMAEK